MILNLIFQQSCLNSQDWWKRLHSRIKKMRALDIKYWLLEIMLHKRPDDCCTLVRSKAGPNASVIARVSLLFTAIKPARYHQSDTRIATIQPITAPVVITRPGPRVLYYYIRTEGPNISDDGEIRNCRAQITERAEWRGYRPDGEMQSDWWWLPNMGTGGAVAQTQRALIKLGMSEIGHW